MLAQHFYTFLFKGEQRKFIEENHLDYIYYGYDEKQLRHANQRPTNNPFSYFPAIYNKNGIIIYDANATL